MNVLLWILIRGLFLTMMSYLLGLPLTQRTIIILVMGYNMVRLLVMIANHVAQPMMRDPARLAGPPNLDMMIDIATLVVCMGGIIMTIRAATAAILEMNA